MHISLDVTYMYTNYGGCDFSGFGDIATFKNGQFSLSTHGLYFKIQLLRISSKKIMQVGVDVTYMYTNFGRSDFSGFGDIATFKNG